MATFAEDHGRRWQPFGLTEAAWAAVPERNGVRVVSVTPGRGQGPGAAGWWPRGAAVALGVLAAAAAAVSWDAQYTMVRAVKRVTVVAALEASPMRARWCSPRWAWRWRCTASGRCGPGR
jgi:hypothetical protein